MKFLKENWFCLLMFVIVVGVVTAYIVKMNRYDDRIQKRDDRIEILESSNESLNRELEDLSDELKTIEAMIPMYADSIDDLIAGRELIKQRHERQISNILSIPSDSVYREVTRWLDSR